MAMDIALFIHLLGVAVLFVALGITQLGGARLRRATSVDEAKLWTSVLDRSGRMFGPAFLLILGAGIYMSADTWGFDRPFVNVGLIAVVVMLVVGFAYVGRTFAKIGRTLEDGGVRAADLPALVNRPGVWAVNFALNAMAVGVIWDMVRKPEWAEAIAVVAGLAVVGALAGSMTGQRRVSAGAASKT